MEYLAALGWLVAGALGARVFWPALSGYGTQKGKNLADKEDIARLTKLVEDVKHENALVLEQIKGQNQLRMAAAEKRLEAHQQAFTLWRRMLADVYKPGVPELVAEARSWWDRNCLYLSAEARDAFSEAGWAIEEINQLAKEPRDQNTIPVLRNASDALLRAGSRILAAVDLPGLSSRDAKLPEEPLNPRAS